MDKMTAGKKRSVKRRVCTQKPTLWIGKSGASQELLSEIEKQLKKNDMVKVKILQSALVEDESKQIASKIAQQAEASLVEVRGHTFILYRHSKK